MNFAIFYERTLHFAAARIKQKAPASSAPSAQREATDSLRAGKGRGETEEPSVESVRRHFVFVLFSFLCANPKKLTDAVRRVKIVV